MSIPVTQDEKAIAARKAYEEGRKSLGDKDFLARLGWKRAKFEQSLQRLEEALKAYEEARGIAYSGGSGAVAVFAATATTWGRLGVGAGSRSLQPEVVIGGLVLMALAAAISGPSVFDIAKEAIADRELTQAMKETADALPGPPPPADFGLLNAVVVTYVTAMVSAALAQQQVALMTATKAQTLAGLLGIPPVNLSPSNTAVNAIKVAMLALLARMPSPPGCRPRQEEYNRHLGRANNSFARGSSYGAAAEKIFANFVEAATTFARCVLGGGGPPPGAAPT
jgi:hypothetical protein